ncbi:peptide chain release factor 2 [Candidatus Saccharibacteria bacterium]|nr:peptide chain release factor 2 [Candidatus Saccharibacteria bacterium]
MQNKKHLEEIKKLFDDSYNKLKIDEKLSELKKLEAEVANPEIWKNPESAREKNEQLSHLKNALEPWQVLKVQISDISELLELGEEDLDAEISEQISALEQTLDRLKESLKFTGPYDHNNAILRITAGAGGTEAMDWAGMLERMYLRFCEKNNFSYSLLERVAGEEAGIKTAVYEISGIDTYGHLKSEHGTHRLVRLSPFNADNLRQTSFSLVEVLPIIKANDEVKIDDKDLRIDTFHSGGHGGQSVNTTNSAIRITHLPTNTVVTIQNERSQLQNKEKAMEILRGKLVQMQLEQQAESINNLRAGESASWGQQIRNYVMQPYKLVKDTRTKYEETDVDAVLDGKIEGFINAFLDYQLK